MRTLDAGGTEDIAAGTTTRRGQQWCVGYSASSSGSTSGELRPQKTVAYIGAAPDVGRRTRGFGEDIRQADSDAFCGQAAKAPAVSRGVGEQTLGQCRRRTVCDLVWFVGRIDEHMAVVDICSGELAVHGPGRPDVGETVTATQLHTFNTSFNRRQQHEVVEMLEPGGCRESCHKPWADHTVVHGRVPTGRIAAGCRGGRLSDDLVLHHGLRKPRWYRTASEECEKRVTIDKHAGFVAVSQNPSDC